MASLDLDEFREMNDTLGRRATDAVIAEVHRRLSELLGDGELIERAGPDEWRLVVSGRDPEDLVGALRLCFGAPMRALDRAVSVTAAIGVAGERDGAARNLVREAEMAMVEARRLGRGHSIVASPTRPVDSAARRLFDDELRAASAAEELRLYLQPLVDAASGQVVGAEALVRWQHPRRGLLLPSTFVEYAERNGAIIDIGTWVLREACRHAATWPASVGGERPSVSVNVSGHQLDMGGFHEVVQESLHAVGLPASSLCVELTETVASQEFRHGWGDVAHLRRQGVLVAIDDFGTGWASFERLASIQADVLKIDRSFVAAMEHGRTERAIVDAIVGLAGSLDLQVVAEGVETVATMDAAVRAGCHQLQGYLFGRPMPADELDRRFLDGDDRIEVAGAHR